MGITVPTLEQLIDNYLVCCATEGKSPKTIDWYHANLVRFSRFLKDQRLDRPVQEIGLAEARKFIYHLQNTVKKWENCPAMNGSRGLAPHSVQGYVRTVKTFWSWLAAEGYLDENCMAKLKVPKVPQKVIATFSSEQIERLLGAPDKGNQVGFRDYTIILVLLDTGVRLSELVGLDIESVDLGQSCFMVTGKGNKERIIPFGMGVRRALWRYLTRFRPEPALPQVSQLFLTSVGFALKASSVQSMVYRLGDIAAISVVACSPHTFRHTFAKQYLMNGGDAFSLQRILGHNSLEMVRNYVNLASEDVSIQHRKYSPVDNMKLSGPNSRANGSIAKRGVVSCRSSERPVPFNRRGRHFGA
jgi:integrase/recombinase XerD